MDQRSKQLRQGSFRGVNFLTSKEIVPQAGQKYAIHDYPNSNKRFAQPLGELPASFDVEAVVTGDDWLTQAENLEKVLKQAGNGRLVLPHRGALDVTALPYKVDYKHKSIGVIGFTLKFTISNADDVPAQASTSVEDVYQASDEAKLDMQSKFGDHWNVPTDPDGILTAANDYRNSVVNTVEVYTSRINNVNDRIQKIVRDVESDLAVLIRDPIGLAEKLIYGNIALADGLFATMSDLFGLSGSSASSALSLINFGEDFFNNGTTLSASKIPTWDNDTGNRVTRNNNRILNIETTRINSLLLGYEAAANFNYRTSEEIDGTIIELEQAYESIMLNNDDDGIFTSDSDFKILLDNVRALSFQVLEQKAQQVYSVSELNVQGVRSSMNLTYHLYAEKFINPESCQESVEELIELNPSKNPLNVSGDVSIFEVS